MARISSLIEQIIAPQVGNLSSEHANYILSLGFNEAQKDRCEELSYKAQGNALTAEERAELEGFLTVETILMLMKSKARQSLQRSSPRT